MNQNPANPSQPALISDQEKQPSNNGTGFVNLQKYLGANQGNQLGNAVSGNINQATNATQSDMASQQNQFNQGLQNARSGIAQGNQNISGTFSRLDDPNFNGLSGQQVQSFQNTVNTPYSGPQGYQNPALLQQQAAQAAGLGQLTGSRAGRQELLRETVNAPQYSNSQRNMDELYLSQGPGQQQVQQAGQGTQRLQGQVNQNLNTAQGQGQQTAKDYGQMQQQGLAGVTSRQAATNAQIADAVNKAQQYRQTVVNPLQQATMSNKLNAAQLGQLGIDPSQLGETTYGVNPYSYLNVNSMTPTAANVASRQQEAQLGALAQLSGQQAPQFDSSQAGTYGATSPYSFNNTGFQNAVNAQKAEYNAQVAGINDPTKGNLYNSGMFGGQYKQNVLNNLAKYYGTGFTLGGGQDALANTKYSDLNGIGTGGDQWTPQGAGTGAAAINAQQAAYDKMLATYKAPDAYNSGNSFLDNAGIAMSQGPNAANLGAYYGSK